jgi:hypothetical protein
MSVVRITMAALPRTQGTHKGCPYPALRPIGSHGNAVLRFSVTLTHYVLRFTFRVSYFI